jgi:hypothetical protein
MENLEIVYADRRVAVAVKPWGVLSTDEPGGMPELLRAQFHQPQGCFRRSFPGRFGNINF